MIDSSWIYIYMTECMVFSGPSLSQQHLWAVLLYDHRSTDVYHTTMIIYMYNHICIIHIYYYTIVHTHAYTYAHVYYIYKLLYEFKHTHTHTHTRIHTYIRTYMFTCLGTWEQVEVWGSRIWALSMAQHMGAVDDMGAVDGTRAIHIYLRMYTHTCISISLYV